MSKKIVINVPNKEKPNLSNLFHIYMSKKADDEMESLKLWREYMDYAFPGWDEGDGENDMDGDVVFPPYKSNKGKKHKHKSYKSKKKGKNFDINTPYEGEEDEYNLDDIHCVDDFHEEHKEIWFYLDYRCKEDRLEFNTISEFESYCDSMGYLLDGAVMYEMSWRYESHCCLDPNSAKSGLFEIVSCYSYGELFYEVCDEYELSNID